MTDAEVLLADVHALRRKARRDRRASAFPLLLFGVLILAAPLCYVPFDPVPDPGGGFTIVDQGPFPLFFGIGPYVNVKYPNLIGWYWFLTIVLGFAATAWWYRRRALGVGVETDTRAHLVTAGAALTGFLIGVPLLEFLIESRGFLRSDPGTNLPILLGSAVASAAVLFWGGRQTRTVPRATGLLVGVLLATVTFAAIGVYLLYGFAALLIIAAGLLSLAWLERSVLLGVTGLLFTATALLANLFEFAEQILPREWLYGPLRTMVLHNLLPSAVVLLAGGIVAALSGRFAR